MPAPPLTLKLTFRMFFDTAPVQRAVDRARRDRLSKAGAFVRTRARSSIRKRKGTSRPGEPPHGHAGHLRRLLLFGYDAQAQTVVVGPLPFNEGEAPELLEFGDGARRPRPFMGPALEAEAPKFPDLFRDSIRR